MMRFHRLEDVSRRFLGAVRLVDAITNAPVQAAARLSAPGVKWIRNPQGLYVISAAPGLEAHIDSFEAAPAAPPVGSLVFTVRIDRIAAPYIPRSLTIHLPRDPDPDHALQPQSLFQPLDARLLPAPDMRSLAGEAVLRVSVMDGNGTPRPGVLLLVAHQSALGTIVARGMTALAGRTAGEAMVRVSALPVTSFDDDEPRTGGGRGRSGRASVIDPNIPIRLTAVLDPAFDPETALPDPDAMESGRAALTRLSEDLTLASGEEKTLRLTMP